MEQKPRILQIEFNSNRTREFLDILAPPVGQQSSQVFDILVNKLDLNTTEVGKRGSSPIIKVSDKDGNILFNGPKEGGEEAIELLRYGIAFAAIKKGDDPVEVLKPDHPISPRTSQAIDFSQNSIDTQTSEEPKTTPEKRPKLKDRARRIAGFALATVLSASSFIIATSQELAEPKPSQSSTSEDFHATKKPNQSEDSNTIIDFEFQNNTYQCEVGKNGKVIKIIGRLGVGENPWTLTKGALQAVNGHSDNLEITNANAYMQSSGLKEEAKRLRTGTTMSWRVRSGRENVNLVPNKN